MPNLPEIIYWIIVNSNLFNKLCWNFIIVVSFFRMHEKPLKPLKVINAKYKDEAHYAPYETKKPAPYNA